MARKAASDVLLEVANILFLPIEERTFKDDPDGKTYLFDHTVPSNLEAVWTDYQSGVQYDDAAEMTFRDISNRLDKVRILLKGYIADPNTELRSTYLVVGPDDKV